MKKEIKKIKKTTLNDVTNTISKWSKDNKDNNVSFLGAFINFNGNNIVIEDRIIAFGNKDIIKLHLEELTKCVKKDKSKFINW